MKLLFVLLLPITLTSCSSFKNMMAIHSDDEQAQGPIVSPFANYEMGAHESPITLRSKKGDRTLELEIPRDESGELASLVMPISPNFSEKSASGDGLDDKYLNSKSSAGDYEIVSNSGPKKGVDDWRRKQIEEQLGLAPTDELVLNADISYLGKVDYIKQLFKLRRYEAALIETDQLIKYFPSSAKLYEMRGTILDRLGHTDLAIKSWKQSVEFDPENLSLKKTLDRKERNRRIASP